MLIEGVEASCEEVRRRAEAAGPESPLPPPSRDHVFECPACQDWLAAQSGAAPGAADPGAARELVQLAAVFLPPARPALRMRWPALAFAALAAIALVFPASVPQAVSMPEFTTWNRSMQQREIARTERAWAEWQRLGALPSLTRALELGVRSHGEPPALLAEPISRQIRWAGSVEMDAALSDPRPAGRREHLLRANDLIQRGSLESRLVWAKVRLKAPISDLFVPPEMQCRTLLLKLLADSGGKSPSLRLAVLSMAADGPGLAEVERERACAEAIELRWRLYRELGPQWMSGVLMEAPDHGWCSAPACKLCAATPAWYSGEFAQLARARIEHAYRTGRLRGALSALASRDWFEPNVHMALPLLSLALPAVLGALLVWLALLAFCHRAALAAAQQAAGERDHNRSCWIAAAVLAGLAILPAYFGGVLWWLVFPGGDAIGRKPRWLAICRVLGSSGLEEKPALLALGLFALILVIARFLIFAHVALMRRADPEGTARRPPTPLFVPLVIAVASGTVDWDQGLVVIPLMLLVACCGAAAFLGRLLPARERAVGARTISAALTMTAAGGLAMGLAAAPEDLAKDLAWVSFLWTMGLALPLAGGFVRAHLSPAAARRTRFLFALTRLAGPFSIGLLWFRTLVSSETAMRDAGPAAFCIALLALVAHAASRVGEQAAPELAGAVAPVEIRPAVAWSEHAVLLGLWLALWLAVGLGIAVASWRTGLSALG